MLLLMSVEVLPAPLNMQTFSETRERVYLKKSCKTPPDSRLDRVFLYFALHSFLLESITGIFKFSKKVNIFELSF